jgi:bifunctional UDP-N-acetylglucosamine pyrophosphorylase/glucosamine-1-phosphate N-acetyltransferase
MTDFLTIVLAAGDGTRMRSDKPKVLHEVGHLPIVSHVVRAARGGGATQIAVVTAPGQDAVRKAVAGIAPEAAFFEQAERRGTGHAARMARPLFEQAEGYVAVVYGDHPLLRAENFRLMIERMETGLDGAILGFEPDDPTGYGRFITDGDRLLAIREHKDASEQERRIGLCNACILAFRAPVFRDLIDKLSTNNAQGEFYATDLVELANEAGHKIGYGVAPERDVMGVNDRKQLARAEALFQDVRRDDFMAAGVTMKDPSTVYVSYDTEIARDVTIEPNVYFGPGVTVESGAVIHAFSHIEGAHIGPGVSVGPFARLRPGAELARNAKVGNFVEIKNAEIGEGAKVNHLTYVGDAEVGARSNLGAGTVTCNYDGINKHHTKIGADVFVGTHSSLVAPVTVGDGAYIATGSVITHDVPADALAIARGRQENKDGYAPRIRARAEAFKKAKTASKE